MRYTHYVLLRVDTNDRYTHETIGDHLPNDLFQDVEVIDSEDLELINNGGVEPRIDLFPD